MENILDELHLFMSFAACKGTRNQTKGGRREREEKTEGGADGAGEATEGG